MRCSVVKAFYDRFMSRYVFGARKTLLPNWAVATCLAGFAAATYFYSIRAVASNDLDGEIASQLQSPKPNSQ